MKSLVCCLMLLSCYQAFSVTLFAQKMRDLSDARLDLMREHAHAIQFKSRSEDPAKRIPRTVESKPLFRYDDLARGYQDGTVWRLGPKGRPLAIVTTELHPRYGLQRTGRSNPRVVYDLLSLTDSSFTANSKHLTWRPTKPAVEMKTLVPAPEPATTRTGRLRQLKQLSRRFQALQLVNEQGTDNQKLVLRLLPKEIDRYQPTSNANSDAATFLFVAGRMPGVILFIETDGEGWQFGVGRLSGPSRLALRLDENEVWIVQPSVGNSSEPYYATNGIVQLPE